MLKIKIISPGITKEQGYKLLQKKFQTMLSPYAQIEWLIAKDFPRQKNQTIEAVRDLEGEELIKALKDAGPLWVLDEKGEQITSPQLAQKLQNIEDGGEILTIIIGGTFGLSEKVKQKATFLWALSKLTLTHEMARCLVLEQIYRGITISKGKNYHY